MNNPYMYMNPRGSNSMQERRLEEARRRHAAEERIHPGDVYIEAPCYDKPVPPIAVAPVDQLPVPPESGLGKEALMHQIMMQDFECIELSLYLNSHPDDAQALALHRESVGRSKALKSEYEFKYGPITQMGCTSTTHWTWSDNPWPWDNKR